MYFLTFLLIVFVTLFTAAPISCYTPSSQSDPVANHRDWFNTEQLYLIDADQDSSRVSTYPYLEPRRTKRSYGNDYAVKSWQQTNYGSDNNNGKWGHKQSHTYGLQKVCKSIASTATDEWCTDNCRQGYCPKSFCVCPYGYGFEKNAYHNQYRLGNYGSYHDSYNYQKYPIVQQKIDYVK